MEKGLGRRRGGGGEGGGEEKGVGRRRWAGGEGGGKRISLKVSALLKIKQKFTCCINCCLKPLR